MPDQSTESGATIQQPDEKRALIFIEDGSFSYDNRVIREVDALTNDGWDVTVISPKYPDDPFYRKVSENVRAYHYPKPNTESVPGHLIEHSFSLFFGAWLTLWVYLRHGFKVFHANNPMDILWIIAWPYKLLGVKFIFDQHDLCPELYLSRGTDNTERSFFYRLLRFLERRSYELADVVIATNESYKQAAVERGGKDPADVFVVRNGPDLDKFRPVPPDARLTGGGKTRVGYLGNMNFQDGVDYLLKAAHDIVHRQARDDIQFVLVGGGGVQADLVRQADRMGLNGQAVFTGRLPDDEMLATLSACDICVQPDPLNALNDKSTMNKVMEYMALEKPVIAFELKETRVSCADAALYARPNEVADLAEKVVYLADHPEARARMAKIGRQRVEQTLAWNYSVPNLLAAYRAAIGAVGAV